MVNPKAVTLARESRGWSQRDLAGARGVSQGRIAKEELGAIALTPETLASLSRLLQYDEEFFTQGEIVFGLGGDFLYRKKAALSARTKCRIEAEANIRRMQVLRLLRSVRSATLHPLPIIQPEEVDGDIEQIAIAVRRAMNIPDGPIGNLTKILENAGCIIFTMDFESDHIDGTNLRIGSASPILYLNEKVSGERHRFNLAHELGHVVMHSVSSLGDPEAEANAFAREFLMPRMLVKYDLRNLDLSAAARLKSVWGVSMAALIHRAFEMKAIKPVAYTRMFKMLSGAGMRRQEPFGLEFERPSTFERLKEFHRQTLGFGEDDLRRLLFTDRLGTLPVPQLPQLKLSGLFEETGENYDLRQAWTN